MVLFDWKDTQTKSEPSSPFVPSNPTYNSGGRPEFPDIGVGYVSKLHEISIVSVK